MPTGTLMNSTARHDVNSVSRPPTISPMAKPPVVMPENIASARMRCFGSVNVVVISASVFGPAAAAPRPWATRAASSTPADVSKPAGQRRDREHARCRR